MKFKKLTSWMSEIKSLEVQNKEILSWLNESGSITSRIKSFSNFRLKLLRDGPGDWICPDCGVGKEDFDMVEIS